jgi:hypothetical protein
VIIALLLLSAPAFSQDVAELKAEHRTGDGAPQPSFDFEPEPVVLEEAPSIISDLPFKKEDLIRPISTNSSATLPQKATFLEDFQETLHFLSKVAGKFLELFRNSDLDKEFSPGQYG